jgi:hypothetical protein
MSRQIREGIYMTGRETLEIFLAVTSGKPIELFQRHVDKMPRYQRVRMEQELGPGVGERRLRDMFSQFPWDDDGRDVLLEVGPFGPMASPSSPSG